MTIPRTGITDQQWRKIKTFFTKYGSQKGRPVSKPRAKLNGILWILRTGAPWRDLPKCYGKWSTVYARFQAWTAQGIWPRLLSFLHLKANEEGQVDWSNHQVDSTIVRAHQHSAGAAIWGPEGDFRTRKTMALGKSRGGWTTKLMIRTDGTGKPMVLLLVPGQEHDSRHFEAIMQGGSIRTGQRGRPRSAPTCVLADKAFNSKQIRTYLKKRGINRVIPQKKNERRRGPFNASLYRQRNCIERGIGVLKQARRVATRYDKLASSYLAFCHIAAIFMWL